MESFPKTMFPAIEDPEHAPNTALEATTTKSSPPFTRPSHARMDVKAPLAIPVSPASDPTSMNMGSTA